MDKGIKKSREQKACAIERERESKREIERMGKSQGGEYKKAEKEGNVPYCSTVCKTARSGTKLTENIPGPKA